MSLYIDIDHQLPGFNLKVQTEIPARGITGIIGPSGAGKTRLLRAISGLDRPQQGCIRFNQTCWQEASVFVPAHLRSVGLVFQEPSLFNHLSVQGNITYGLCGKPSINSALKKIIEGLGISALLNRSVTDLSGGEARRVAIARALAPAPDLLLMDEPLSGLEQSRRQQIMLMFEHLAKTLGVPVLFVSHEPAEISRLADHLVMLREGRVVSQGPMAETLVSLEGPFSRQYDALTVVDALVLDIDTQWGLATLDVNGGQWQVPSADINSPLEPGQRVRLGIAAKDVSLSIERPSSSSILNVLAATVSGQEGFDSAQVTVQLSLGLKSGDSAQPAPKLLARVTRRSAHELNLIEGRQVFALVKSVAVLQ